MKKFKLFKKEKNESTRRYKVSWLMDILIIVEIVCSVALFGSLLFTTNKKVKTNTEDIITINGKIEKIERQLTKLDGQITNITNEKITVNGVERSVVNTVKAIAGYLGNTQISVVEVDGSYYSVDTSLISNVQSLSARINTVENSCSVLSENYVEVNGKVVRVESELESYKNGTNEQLQATVNSLKNDLQEYAEGLEVSVVDSELRSFVFTTHDFEYECRSGELYVVSLKAKNLPSVSSEYEYIVNSYRVDEEILGLPVVGINKGVFNQCQYFYSLSLRSNIVLTKCKNFESSLDCSKLYKLSFDIPSSNVIRSSTLSNCTNLRELYISGVSSIAVDAFVSMSHLEYLTLPFQYQGTTFTFASGVNPTINYI